MNNVNKLRLWVFRIWFLTLGVIVASFGLNVVGLFGIPHPFSATFQSLQMMTGLVVPQLTIMVAFYFNLDKQKNKIDALSDEQVSVVTWLSIAYHGLFIATVIFGIGFYGFDRGMDGGALQRNAAAVVSIMGLFSICVAPIAFLFARPQAGTTKGAGQRASIKGPQASNADSQRPDE